MRIAEQPRAANLPVACVLALDKLASVRLS
jgi:hypothetical protein